MAGIEVPAPFLHASQHAPGGIDEDVANTYGNVSGQRQESLRRVWLDTTGGAHTSTNVTFTFWSAGAAITYSKIGLVVTVQGSGVTLARLGLYTVAANGDLTLVARTANDPTIGTVAAGFEVSRSMDTTGGFPASYTLTKGARYATARIFIFSTTSPQHTKQTFFSPASALAPRIGGFIASQSDLPTSVTAASLSALGGTFYDFLDV